MFIVATGAAVIAASEEESAAHPLSIHQVAVDVLGVVTHGVLLD
ncbi:hypothetical protein JCM19235_1310 [Vibrio maritimus]|uniref:Uncharacterized protein n=1 Tax=Vibrio maritimus TaxID=990268 RepID=A0A090S941_9VIBR|nr:hypothetical protein JCM19235_1310 [Vibrio maritimus]